jgi:hypothetical protein
MSNPIEEFLSVVDRIYGTYLDGIRGFHMIYRDTQFRQLETAQEFRESAPENANSDYLNSRSFIYSMGYPDEENHRELHTVPQGEYKQRNAKGGTNHVFIANMAIVAIYQYWEDFYRNEIASYLNYEGKNDLKMPIMGDLKELRHSIIHHHGAAIEDIKKCTIVTWFKADDPIELTSDHMEIIVIAIKKALTALH